MEEFPVLLSCRIINGLNYIIKVQVHPFITDCQNFL
jgi:hypothetical protein